MASRSRAAGAGRPGSLVEGGWEEFRRELERSRRHQRPFCVLRVAVAEGEADRTSSTAADLAAILASRVRRIDRVWSDDRGCWLLLPESTRSDALTLLERIHADVPEATATSTFRVAMFPDDAVTGGALLAALERDVSRAGAGPETAAEGEALIGRLMRAIARPGAAGTDAVVSEDVEQAG